MNKSSSNIGLFVSCLVDLTRPEVGFAAVKLLEQSGCKVTIPKQTCCGQPAYNSGCKQEAKEIAKVTIEAFQDCEAVVVPSASCAGMLKHHIKTLFEDPSKESEEWSEKAKSLSDRTYELTDFLYFQKDLKKVSSEFKGRIAYHESCSARREMKLKAPLLLLNTLKGAEIIELASNEECCGFGGLFSVKFDEISNAMVQTKVNHIKNANIDVLTGVDLGCLMNIGGKLAKEGHNLEVRHIAEILAD
ncbi:MAG: (Fe-S)-binding protein [Rhodomicrobiaceae bacterium]